jgi:LacI family transcriptional regulator
MAKRPTIRDLAEASGVSLATVDRVINRRAPVRTSTALRVMEAARNIGFYAAPLIQERVASTEVPVLNLGLILPSTEQDFYSHFAAEAERAVMVFTSAHVRLTTQFISASDPDRVVQALDSLGQQSHAIAAVAVDHPKVTAQVEQLRTAGIPVYALLSEIGQGAREAFIGTDNLKVGRTAAMMLARAIPRQEKAALALFVGGHRWHGHELRETGFRTWLRQNRPDITMLETQVNLDNADMTFEALLLLVARNPHLVGVYCAGGGREGLIRAIRVEGLVGRLDVVANEFSEVTKVAMTDGIVSMTLDTPVFEIMTEYFKLAAKAVSEGLGKSNGQRFMPVRIVLPESY